jgi:hypothetical protein
MVSYARYRPEGYLSAFDIHILDVKPKHISTQSDLSPIALPCSCAPNSKEPKAA